jgi:hypothetical protein
MRHLLAIVAAVFFLPVYSLAQTALPGEPRVAVDGGIGFGSTWDDEGLLGRGAAVSGGFGVRLSRRVWLRGFVDRVTYFRDVEWLTFDGRILFAGAEADVRFAAAGITPYVSFGAGVLNDAGIWIRKSQVGQSRVDEQIDRSGSKATMTVSGGIEVPVSDRASIRGGVRYYGLLDTGDDLFPHVVLQPMAAVVIRF